MSVTELEPRSRLSKPSEGLARVIHHLFQRFGMNGGLAGTNGRPEIAFLYSLAIAAAIVGVVNTENVLSILGMHHSGSIRWALIDEGSSWLTFVSFFWIIWLGWRLASPSIRPRWKLVLHIPLAITFCAAHVGGFLLLRMAAYSLAGASYNPGPLLARFFYEFQKDAFAYALFLAGITLIDHLLRQPRAERSLTFNIRDGAKIARVVVNDILAVMSAGNYVEFLLLDGRRLLMRAPLSTVEQELGRRGFLRVHRSWIVNRYRVRTLRATGSGDFQIGLETGVNVPLSRRFRTALDQLRGA